MKNQMYKLNRTTLSLEPVKPKKHTLAYTLVTFSVLSLFLFLSFHTPLKREYVHGETVIKIENELHKFSEELLIKEVKKYNFKFPEVIVAQAFQESGYNSPIFKDNHNLFGMKEAHIRINVAKGTHRGHAYYNNWRESLLDRALYEEAYLRKINDRETYIQFLHDNYAGSPNYADKLKQIIKKRRLNERLERE